MTQPRRWLARLLTKEAVANAFGRDDQTIDLWRRDRDLPSVDIPGRPGGKPAVRFDPAEVRAWAKSVGQEIVNPWW